jgi:hypothetical protein
MKMKHLLIVSVLLVALAVLLAPVVLAQDSTPTQPGDDCPMMQPGGRMSGMMGRGGMMGWAGLPDEVAELLDLSEDEIEAARQDGKSLAEIAKAQGVEKDDLVATILEARSAALDALVKDGKLTQAQADLMAERMAERIAEMVDRTETGPMWQDDDGDAGPMMWRNEGRGGMRGHGGMRGRGGMGGMRGWQQPNEMPMRMQSF